MTRLVAIHQPNFLPWLGWFDKLARADAMVLLDDVQFPKTGANATNRVQILLGGTPRWITVPVVRAYHGTRTIAEMRIDESQPWRNKLLRTLRQGYASAPCLRDVWPVVEACVGFEAGGLAEYNEHGIRTLAETLGLDTAKLIRSSGLDASGAATERLVSIVRKVGGDGYLVGGGAEGYQDGDLFAAAGIALVRQNFEATPYPQQSPEFVPGLSAIDALLSCGAERAQNLLRS